MNRDDLGSRLELLQAHCDRILPALSTFDDRHRLFETCRLHEIPHFIHSFTRCRYDDVVDHARCIEFSDGVHKDGSAIECKKLLRTVRLHTTSETRSRDDCANGHNTIYRFPPLVRNFRGRLPLGRGSALRPRVPIIAFLAFLTLVVWNLTAFFFVPAKDHLAGGGLQHAGYG